MLLLKVYMVSGGYRGLNEGQYLDSTEILSPGSASWTQVGSLPVGVYGIRGAGIGNTVFMFGKSSTIEDTSN